MKNLDWPAIERGKMRLAKRFNAMGRVESPDAEILEQTAKATALAELQKIIDNGYTVDGRFRLDPEYVIDRIRKIREEIR